MDFRPLLVCAFIAQVFFVPIKCTGQDTYVQEIMTVWRTHEYLVPSHLKKTTTFVDPTGVKGKYIQEFKVSRKCALFVSSREDGSLVARGWNNDYWFEVLQRESESTWQLTDVGELPFPKKYFTDEQIIESEIRQGLYYRMCPLLEMFSDPGFTITKSQTHSSNSDLIEIQFQFSPSEDLKNRRIVSEACGTIWLSKADNYLVSKIQDEQFNFEMSDYVNEGNICSVARNTKQRYLPNRGEENHETEMSFAEIDPADFRLTAFGLIEPEFLVESNWIGTVTVLLVILIFAGIVCWRYIRPHQRN
jgi:hypothetical protein